LHFIPEFWGALIGLVTFVSLNTRHIFQTPQSIQGGRIINYQVAQQLGDHFCQWHRVAHIQPNYRHAGDWKYAGNPPLLAVFEQSSVWDEGIDKIQSLLLLDRLLLYERYIDQGEPGSPVAFSMELNRDAGSSTIGQNTFVCPGSARLFGSWRNGSRSSLRGPPAHASSQRRSPLEVFLLARRLLYSVAQGFIFTAHKPKEE
jgi:hypothetical protein